MKKAPTDYPLIEHKERPITTAYFDHNKELIKRIKAVNPNAAMMRAFSNMATNYYGADSVQVYATGTGRLYGEIIRTKDDQVKVTFKVKPAEFDDPLHRNPERTWAVFI